LAICRVQVIRQVVDKFIAQLEAQFADRAVTIELTDEAREWLADNGYDEQMGARPMGRLIQQTIKTPLADEVLFGRLKTWRRRAVVVVVASETTGLKVLGFRVPARADHTKAGEGRARCGKVADPHRQGANCQDCDCTGQAIGPIVRIVAGQAFRQVGPRARNPRHRTCRSSCQVRKTLTHHAAALSGPCQRCR
jgi:hypothetical protein